MAKVRPLSKALQEKACKELNEDVARIPDDIKAIKEWLKQKKYIVARTGTIYFFDKNSLFGM